MSVARVKSQVLSLALDFDNERVDGTTLISFSLGFPPEVGRVFVQPPANDVVSSGLWVGLRCPGPDICHITSVEVGGVPSQFVHEGSRNTPGACYDVTPDGVYDLLTFDTALAGLRQSNLEHHGLAVDLPPLALHRVASRTLKPKVPNGEPSADGSQKKVSIGLKLTISFTLFNLTPLTASAYFTSHTLRPWGNRNALTRYPLFLSRPEASYGSPWFPALLPPHAWDSGKHKKSLCGAFSWVLHLTVPEGMTVVGPGVLTRRTAAQNTCFSKGADNHTSSPSAGPTTTFTYESRGLYGAIPVHQVGCFAGYLSARSHVVLQTAATGWPGPETLKRRASLQSVDGNGSFKPDEPALGSPQHEHVERENSPAPDTETSKKPIHCSVLTLLGNFPKHAHRFLWKTVEEAIKALQSSYAVEFPFPEMRLMFLPVGMMQIALGNGVWTKESVLCDAIPHPGLNATFWLFGNVIVFDHSLLHGTENHTIVFRSQEIIAEGIISILFGASWACATLAAASELSKNWWLLVALRRYAVDAFMRRVFGQEHVISMQWLRLDLYARLVETGYDTTPLSSASLPLQTVPFSGETITLASEESRTGLDGGLEEDGTPQASKQQGKGDTWRDSDPWFNAWSITPGLKASFVLPSLDVFLSYRTTAASRPGTPHDLDPSVTRWSPPPGTLASFLYTFVGRHCRRGPGNGITTHRFLERDTLALQKRNYISVNDACVCDSGVLQLERGLRVFFVNSGAWRRAYAAAVVPASTESDVSVLSGSTRFPTHTVERLPPPTADTLNLDICAKFPRSDIRQLILDVQGFFSSWVFGTGCPIASLGLSLQLQKKSASLTIESLRVIYDEVALQPPCAVDSYTGISEFSPASLAALPALEALLEEAGSLDTAALPEDGASPKNPASATAALSYRTLFANHDITSFLGESGITLFHPSSPSPYELILKDNGWGIGFGYTGRDPSPITGGAGHLYQAIETRLNASWSFLEPEQRALLTADMPSRFALMDAHPEGRTIPLATPPPYPDWFFSTLCGTAVKDGVRLAAFLEGLQAVRTGCVPVVRYLARNARPDDSGCGLERKPEHTLAGDGTSGMMRGGRRSQIPGIVPSVIPSPGAPANLPLLSAPLSAGFGKLYADALSLYVCTERGIVQETRFLRVQELPVRLELCGFDGGVPMILKASGRNLVVGPSATSGSPRPLIAADGLSSETGTFGAHGGAGGSSTSARHFTGVLSSADAFLFASEATGPFSAVRPGTGTLTKGATKKERAKHLPLLWYRIMGPIRPIWLARFFRCQSVAMWEQQLLNDPFVTSQLEAAKALGNIVPGTTVAICLGSILRQHDAHPLVRSFAALSLQRLHNNPSNLHAQDCLTSLLGYLYIYHYRSLEINSHGPNGMGPNTGRPPTKVEPLQQDESFGIGPSVPPEDSEEGSESMAQNQGHGNVSMAHIPKQPPFWMTTEMIFLKDLLLAVAGLRGIDGKTLFEAVDALTQPLMHHVTDVRSCDQVNADYYIAHMLSALAHMALRAAPWKDSLALEDVALPAWYRGYERYPRTLFPDVSNPDGVARSILQFQRWRDEIDCDTESVFLHIWRYFRLDYCLHSSSHVITASCLKVMCCGNAFRDLLRLKICDELQTDLQLLSFLPLNFLPLILAFKARVKNRTTASSASTTVSHRSRDWSGCAGHGLAFRTASGALIARHQMEVLHELDVALAKPLTGTPSQDDRFFNDVILSGVREISSQILRNYAVYQDPHVERAALSGLLYCTAVGAIEPPLVFLTGHSPLAFHNLHCFRDVLNFLYPTFILRPPTAALHSILFEPLTEKFLQLRAAALSSHSEKRRPSFCYDEVTSQSDRFIEAHVARYLFCCRWTSLEEAEALQRSGIAVLNAVLFACRLEEFLTLPDAAHLLLGVWESLIEILGKLIVDAPLALAPFWMKPCRLGSDSHRGHLPSTLVTAATNLQSRFSFFPQLDDRAYCDPDFADDFFDASLSVERKSKKRSRASKPHVPPSTLDTAPERVCEATDSEARLQRRIRKEEKKRKKKEKKLLQKFSNLGDSTQGTTDQQLPGNPLNHTRDPHDIPLEPTQYSPRSEPESISTTHLLEFMPPDEEDKDYQLPTVTHRLRFDTTPQLETVLDNSPVSPFHPTDSIDNSNSMIPTHMETLLDSPAFEGAEPREAHSSGQYYMEDDIITLHEPELALCDEDEMRQFDTCDPTDFAMEDFFGQQSSLPDDGLAEDDVSAVMETSGNLEAQLAASYFSEHDDTGHEPAEKQKSVYTAGASQNPPLERCTGPAASTSTSRPSIAQVETFGGGTSAPFWLEDMPVALCAKVLWAYLNGRAVRGVALSDQRVALVKEVYSFLFGVGVPQCFAFAPAMGTGVPSLQVPDPSLVDSFITELKTGRYLQKLCLFQKRYLDDNADVPDWQYIAMEIVDLLMGLPLAAAFLDKVHPKDVPEYRNIVKNPMWLKRIAEKLQLQKYTVSGVYKLSKGVLCLLYYTNAPYLFYRSYEEWKNDVFLIFRNCRIFNAPDSKIVQDCEALQNIVYMVLRPTEKLLTRKASRERKMFHDQHQQHPQDTKTLNGTNRSSTSGILQLRSVRDSLNDADF